jgi:hypothetical protein
MFIFIIVGSFIAGYFVRIFQTTLKKATLKDSIDLLLDELSLCGEPIEVKIIKDDSDKYSNSYRSYRKLTFDNGIIITDGVWEEISKKWEIHPNIYINGISVLVSKKQKNKIRLLLRDKHMELGARQITDKLLDI